MDDFFNWGGLALTLIGVVISAITLGFVVAERRQRRWSAKRAFLTAGVSRRLTTSDGRVFDVVDVANTGTVTADVMEYAFVGIRNIANPPDTGFFPVYLLAPGQSFALALPTGTPRDVWIRFLYTEQTDLRFVSASWKRVYGGSPEGVSLTRWQRVKRRITPTSRLTAFPVGPGGSAQQSVHVRKQGTTAIASMLSGIPEGTPAAHLRPDRETTPESWGDSDAEENAAGDT